MTERAKKFLSDILMAIEAIESFLDSDTSFDAYHNDAKTKSAVERQLSIIGEAVNQYHKEEGVNELTYVTQIVGFRNRLIHAYDNLDDTIVWVILKKYLPTLKRGSRKLYV